MTPFDPSSLPFSLSTVGFNFDTIIVGLGYKARQGKNYTAQHIADSYPGVVVTGFAAALKTYGRIAFGMRGKDPRLLQLVGTDLYRHIDPLIWIRVLHDTIAETKPRIVILTDVRFPNEAEYILSAGGYLAEISRTNENGNPYVARDRDPQHESETSLDSWFLWDFTVSAPSGRLDLLESAGNTIYDQACAKHAARLRVLVAADPTSTAVF